MQDVSSKYNSIVFNQLDKYIFSSKPADSIVGMLVIVKYIEGSALLHHNQIILIDNRVHIIDINE